eukprot:CAMPEP_0197024288 /NCGR_PEP_ID=MMETSP1384-20130603/4865_1 /TAXON_ID=29189 /ORGANISM="Ammonia sp." /LENGTH=766 /DNA_ID=CAMNT_0042452649 /DNA_START=22 /DNA_END=2322 /DNA_ORIENTATION=+
MSSDWRSSLNVGTRIDIYDVAYSDWYRGSVIEIGADNNAGKVKVTYDGYNSDFDEYIELNSWRLAEFSAHTTDEPAASAPAAVTDAAPTLTGSQLQTYTELVGMGFDAADCSTVAQIYGSNLEGAINAILSGNVDRLTRTMSSGRTRLRDLISLSSLRSSDRNQEQESNQQDLFKLALEAHAASKENDNDDAPDLFRVTRVHHLFMNGFVRQQTDLEYIVHDDILLLIVKYVNIYFIKFSYDRKCQHSRGRKAIERAEHKQDDDVDVDVEEHRYWVLHKNETFRQVIRKLEEHYKYDYKELAKTVKDLDPLHYCYFIRLWTKFKYMKSIYSLKKSETKAMDRDITMDMIEKYGYDTNANQDRWVEIPNDFEDASIMDVDKLFAKVDKYGVLELGVDRFNSCTKRWTFYASNIQSYMEEIRRLQRAKKALPPAIRSNDNESTVYCMLFSGLPKGVTPLSLWKAIERVAKKKPMAPQRPKRWNDEALVYVQGVDVSKLVTMRQITVNDTVVNVKVIDKEEEQQWIFSHCSRTSIVHTPNLVNEFESYKSWRQEAETVAVSPSPPPVPAPLPANIGLIAAPTVKRIPKNWKCVSCGTRNHKTYVICGGCFTDKNEELYEYEEVAEESPKAPPLKNKDKEREEEAQRPVLPSKAPIPNLQWTKQLQIGDIVDVLDAQDKWYEAVIRCIEINHGEKLLYVHYIGWSKKWDESVMANDVQRVAERNTKTNGPHRPKRSSFSTDRLQDPTYYYPSFQRSVNQPAKRHLWLRKD